MKKALSVILSVFLIIGATACGRLSRDDSTVNMVSSQGEVYLSRTESDSVYGVEAPDAQASILLDQAEQSSSESEPMPSSSAKEVSASSATAAVPQPQASSAASESQAKEAAAKPVSSEAASSAQEVSRTEVLSARPVSGEMRGVWMSYITLEPLVKNKTKAQFTANIDAAFGKIADFGCNTVFVQVRPFADALYKSSYFPWSLYLTDTEGQNPGYDPLAIMCGLADAHGLRIEAWINPYRVRTSKEPMSADNQAKKWLDSGNDSVIEWNGGIYYNPGSEQARKLIVNGVKEIVSNYNVDGIHFDDYFYPTTDMSFDKATYKASGSGKTQADWRRENVNILVRDVYAAVKSINSSCVFGISPQGNTKNNYDGQFIDCAKWLSNSGYVDYICPQIYYGYDNSTNPYSATVSKWNSMIKTSGIKLYVGVAAYKLGLTDEWAGEGKNEWLDTNDILANMVVTAREASHYGGVAFYSYESLFAQNTSQIKSERASLKELF
ncbi:family 10 glycosylhydrolase [Oscillospiraceae bacterium PP1C4]